MFIEKRLGTIAAACTAAALFLANTASSRAGADAVPFTSCSSASPCVTDSNAGAGPGLKSASAHGTGLVGKTSFNSTSPSNGAAGVNGQDGSTTGTFDSGVKGTSTRGFGVTGTSASGSGVNGTATTGIGVNGVSTNNAGVAGSSTNSSGVVGTSTNSVGVAGNASTSYGVAGTSSTSYGVLGTTHGTVGSVAGVEGTNNASTTAVRANGFGGDLFVGNASTGTDVFRVDNSGDMFASHQVSTGLDGSTAFGLEAEGTVEAVVGIGLSSGSAGIASTGVSGAAMYVATNSSNTRTLLADDAGNLTITGLIFTAGGCAAGCVANQKAPGTRVVTYAPREAAPTIEDVGEGQLVGGKTYVALDPEFANVIDQHSNYFVFITPEGDNRGLFVTGKSTRGFYVYESQSGHSTLPFSYRIVAKPYGPTQPRLARVNFAAQPRHAMLAAPAHYTKKP